MNKKVLIAVALLLLLLVVGGGGGIMLMGGGAAVAYYYYVLTGQEPPPELVEEMDATPKPMKMPVIQVKEKPPEVVPDKPKVTKRVVAKVEPPPPPPPAAPTAKNGGVLITGDKPGVFMLEGADGKRYSVMPEVPPGQYAIIGAWDTESLHGLGTITVSDAQTTVKCSVSWGKCSNK